MTSQRTRPEDLAGRWLTRFFIDHLAGERAASPWTIASPPQRIFGCILSARMHPKMRHFIERRRSDAPPRTSTIARLAMLGRPWLASRQERMWRT
jgi:hypothetical protein